ETDYKLDGPHKTIAEAKEAFKVTYVTIFGITWTERETAVSERFTYQTITHEVVEETEVIEEVIEETEVTTVVTEETKSTTGDVIIKEETKTINQGEEIILEHHEQKETVIEPKDEVEEKEVTVAGEKKVIEVATKIEKGVVTQPAVPKKASWFRRVVKSGEDTIRGVGSAVAGAAESAAHGVGQVAQDVATGAEGVAYGALQKVDGVWKRTVQVLTIRKAKVDEVAPIAKHSFVYYDEDEVYDCVFIEKSTGKKYVTQLLYDTKKEVFYVYYRWSETEYTLDGPHEDVESAKEAFKISYTQKFGIEWKERETAVT
ncbi:hypothetical protein BX616_008194, partial [Lobosporangium transversale]